MSAYVDRSSPFFKCYIVMCSNRTFLNLSKPTDFFCFGCLHKLFTTGFIKFIFWKMKLSLLWFWPYLLSLYTYERKCYILNKLPCFLYLIQIFKNYHLKVDRPFLFRRPCLPYAPTLSSNLVYAVYKRLVHSSQAHNTRRFKIRTCFGL